MKCINNGKRLLAGFLAAVFLTGCGGKELVESYQGHANGSVWQTKESAKRLDGMAMHLCVANEAVIPDNMTAMAGAAGLFDISGEAVLYASGIHEKMYPASITKLMTALLFLERYGGDFTEVVTASENVRITEPGAQVCGYKPGDQVSLEQLLYGLLLYSGNDAAVMIAEYTAGSEEAFVNLMNERAVSLGATNTHFVNPHGLNDEEHYSTAYDLYLIFQEVMKHEKFRQVINAKLYEGEYQTALGETKKVSWKSTNLFFSGEKQAPEGVVVIGGKTGTTKAAGSCLILLSQNALGNEYVSVVLKAQNRDELYEDMTALLGQAAAVSPAEVSEEAVSGPAAE